MKTRKKCARFLAISVTVMMCLMAFSTIGINAKADTTNGWFVMPTMGDTRTQAVTLADSSGVVYVIGGVIDALAYNEMPNVNSYDPVTGDWTDLALMPVGTRGAAGAVGPDGMMYVFGGTNGSGVQIYNPVNNTWSTGTDAPSPVGWEARAATHGDEIYVISGETALGMVQVYDPAGDSWSSGSSMLTGLMAGVAVSYGQYIYYIGGAPPGYVGVDTVQRYDVAGDTWEYVATLPIPLTAHAAEVGADGMIYAFGGSNTAGNTGGASYNSVYYYNPANDTWTQSDNMPYSGKYLGSAPLPDGSILALGGNVGTNALNNVALLANIQYNATLSSDKVNTGGSVLLTLESDFTPYLSVDSASMQISLTSDDDTVYDSFSFYVTGPLKAGIEIRVPEIAEPGLYIVSVTHWGVWLNGWMAFFEIPTPIELNLTVNATPTIDEKIGDLNDDVNDLNDDVNDLNDDVNDLQEDLDNLSAAMNQSGNALMGELNNFQSEIDDLKDDVDTANEAAETAKNYAMIGMFVAIIIAILVAVNIAMVMKKKP